MASSNKTTNLNLSQWVSDDCPKMDDFNQDNQKIDTAFGQHTEDETLHLSQTDRQWLDTPFLVGSYVGDGVMRKVVPLAGTPKFLLVSQENSSPYQFDTSVQYAFQRFAVLFGNKGTNGIEADAEGFAVYQSVGGTSAGGTSICLNESGKTYWYVAVM